MIGCFLFIELDLLRPVKFELLHSRLAPGDFNVPRGHFYERERSTLFGAMIGFFNAVRPDLFLKPSLCS